ncbi:MAG: hypothetical protein AAFR38_07745, partial [Planctomycetota bacterium]
SLQSFRPPSPSSELTGTRDGSPGDDSQTDRCGDLAREPRVLALGASAEAVVLAVIAGTAVASACQL